MISIVRSMARFVQFQVLNNRLVQVCPMYCACFYSLEQLKHVENSDHRVDVCHELAPRSDSILQIPPQHRRQSDKLWSCAAETAIHCFVFISTGCEQVFEWRRIFGYARVPSYSPSSLKFAESLMAGWIFHQLPSSLSASPSCTYIYIYIYNFYIYIYIYICAPASMSIEAAFKLNLLFKIMLLELQFHPKTFPVSSKASCSI